MHLKVTALTNVCMAVIVVFFSTGIHISAIFQHFLLIFATFTKFDSPLFFVCLA